MRDINTIKQEIRNAEQTINSLNSKIQSLQNQIDYDIPNSMRRSEYEISNLERSLNSREINSQENIHINNEIRRVQLWIKNEETGKGLRNDLIRILQGKISDHSRELDGIKRHKENLEHELKDAEQKQAWNEKSKRDFDKYDKGGPSTSGFKKSFGF